MAQIRVETEIEAAPEEVRAIVCQQTIIVSAPINPSQDP
jgi:hypothetical protein